MGTHFTLAFGAKTGNRTKKRTASKINLMKAAMRVNLSIVLAALAVVLSVLYLIQVNSVSTKGYEIRALEVQLRELKESSKRLELEATELRSIQDLEQAVRLQGLVPSSAVQHLPSSDYAFQD